MHCRPLHDRVVVRRIEAEEKTSGGIIIPDTAKEKPQEGEIVAVGPGARADAGRLVEPSVKTGDRVLLGQWSGTEIGRAWCRERAWQSVWIVVVAVSIQKKK